MVASIIFEHSIRLQHQMGHSQKDDAKVVVALVVEVAEPVLLVGTVLVMEELAVQS